MNEHQLCDVEVAKLRNSQRNVVQLQCTQARVLRCFATPKHDKPD